MGVNLYGVMVGTQRAARHMARARRRCDREHRVDRRAHRRRRTDRVPRVEGGGRPVQPVGMAIDLAPHSIRVNCIAPGHIATGITNYDMGPVIQNMQPLQRHGDPSDVAEAVLYLVSDRVRADHRDRAADRRRHDRGPAGHAAPRPHARREGVREGDARWSD